LEFLQDHTAHRIFPISEYAVTVEWPSEQYFHLVRQLNGLLHNNAIPGCRETVPAYHSLTIFLDVQQTDVMTATATLHKLLESTEISALSVSTPEGRLLEIPVCYSAECGPDLSEAARKCGLSESDFIDIHSGTEYQVFMLGFAPGFPYMGWVDGRIALNRHNRPRMSVPAGSVAIAGTQTGIYPNDSPGGWQIIGQTPLPLLKDDPSDPFLFHPGDRVKFVPITAETFKALKG
jgi:inhibitor of KinA